MNGKPTIQMVAELAGVSRSTVDRVLNGRPHVNEEARRQALEAAPEIGYAPLSRHRTEDAFSGALTLGILLPNWEGQFRAEVARGIRLARTKLEEAGTRVLLRRCKTDSAAALTDEAENAYWEISVNYYRLSCFLGRLAESFHLYKALSGRALARAAMYFCSANLF